MNDFDYVVQYICYFERGTLTFPGMDRKVGRGISLPENKRTNMERDNTLIPLFL